MKSSHLKLVDSDKNEVVPYVDSFIVDATHFICDIATLLVIDSREREAKKRLDNQARAVQLITDAIFEGRRITLDDISQYVCTAYLSKQEIADKLHIPLTFLKAGLKRWYHLF